ncbi:hypothetical protein [Paractinoplanes lichenicola]|uniref:Uncharacterized protein n=1 Tax=Paractinoplanes lichenicola TaxID=2802976 RepID=A0ABS1VVW6_9ACTN|nr:hypothetical protein [Actinoplanes lichenicola]MBL7258614.1 hypothetical protein [Actinoplanes lichenicola]
MLPETTPDDDDVAELRDAFDRLDGLVELPADRRFIVITVPLTAGFPAIEAAVNAWTAARNCGWEYGNVHDEDWWVGEPG